MLSNIPLSLYIHIPWCIRKCPYCDFNSHQLRKELPEQEYLQALKNDFDNELAYIQQREIQSIFIGGGTPSLFSPDGIAEILQYVASKACLKADAEITMEANPGTFEQQKFIAFRQAGVNRLSIGIQSFDEQKLKILGRIHDGEQAKKAIEIAHNSGFNSFNLDLMFALPEQTQQQALADLQQALEFEPPHLSWYQLTLEPNTAFYFKPPQLPDDDNSWEMQQAGQELLAKAAYQHYEVSAYAREKHQSKHNLNYWQFGDYVAIGAGAHGKSTDLITGEITRYSKHKHPTIYMQSQHDYIAESQLVKSEDIAFEFMLNTLRLQQPITMELFQQRTGLTMADIRPQLDVAQQKQLIRYDDNSITCTADGHRFLNDLVVLFLNN